MFLIADGSEVWIATGDSIQLFGPDDDVVLRVPLPASYARHALGLGEIHFISPQCFFSMLSLGDVDGHPQHAFGLAVGAVIESASGSDPAHRAILPSNAEFGGVRLMAVHR